MEIQQILYVVRAAEQMSFSKAAEHSHVTQSCLSQQIAKLENELGFRLFERTTRCVLLTEQGEHFVRHAHKVLEDLDMLKTSFCPTVEKLQGTLRIGAIGSMATSSFSRLIGGFSSRYPQLTFRVIQAGSLELLELLRRHEIDAAFITSMQQPEENSEFCMTTISSFSYFLAVPKGHRLAQEPFVHLEELREEPFVFHDRNLAMYRICMRACREAGFEPKIVCTTTHAWFRYYMIEAGLGIGFFPYEDFLSFPANRVSRLRIRPAIEPLLSLAVLRQTEPNPLVDTFHDFVRTWIHIHHSSLHEEV
ncbi:LysR family transcriptional regulator [Yanshouia hominis]|uniref:LysR family transcriptional regulator n=1 Tax=Yanshouia hominis TaxID=2763673 RepID=A0ABR7NLG9_9FIRM|nr:LysR family transcriptional regulator [Yanshouia hominis]MBC8577246.1 LysR family transcriptional regulator [Yanshouia hominis]